MPAQYLNTALGWRYRSSLKRKRRKSVATGTGAPVPVPDPTFSVPLADPDNLDARRCLPDSRLGTTVPEIGPAIGIAELHPLDGVRHGRDLVLLLLHLLDRLLERTHHAISARRG